MLGLVAALHKAMLLFQIVATFGMAVVFSYNWIKNNFAWRRLVPLVLVFVVLVTEIQLITNKDAANAPDGIEAAAAAMTADTRYMERVLEKKSSREARATYTQTLQFSSPTDFVKSGILVIVHYLFEPFPWKVSKWIDVYGVIESIARFMLIGASFLAISRATRDKRSLMLVLMIGYFILTCIWAVGTTNYGTAMRHNITQNWIIILLGWPVIFSVIKLNLQKFSYSEKR
jgi:hypothetical protein